MSNLKRNKPLMIDSHTTPSFIDSDYIYNDIDSPDDNENIIVNATENLSRRRGYVELESDSNDQNKEDLAVEEVISPSGKSTKIGVINKNDLYNSYINDTEIETINNAKNVTKTLSDFQMSNNINTKNKKLETSKPIIKRLKTSDIQSINHPPKNVIKIPNVQNFQIMNSKTIMPTNINQNTIVNNTIETEKEASSNKLLESNNFFYINSVGNLVEMNQNNSISDVTQQPGLIESMNLIEQGSSDSPIVRMPASPNRNSNRNAMLINEQATNENSNSANK